jgi:hypothetical protein
MTIQYSCLQSFYPGLGNVTNNPNLNAADGYKLTLHSPAIDVGTSAFMPAADLLGVPRPLDGDTNGVAVVDMGCYEYMAITLDSDSDGIPDWWTWQYYGHMAGQESDNSMASNFAYGSRRTNLEKYGADLDPTDPLSDLEITGLTLLPIGIQINWRGGRWSRQYIETRQSLSDTTEQWAAIFTNLPPTATATNFIHADATNQSLFFRVRAAR